MSTPEPSRERIDELIAVADRVAHRPLPPPRSRAVPVAMLAVGGLLAVVIGVKLASGGDGADSSSSVQPGQTTAVPTAVTTVAPPTTMPVVITLPPTSPPTVAPTAVPSSAATTTTMAVDPASPVRFVQYASGKAYLMGTVPDQPTADALVAKAAAVVGPENVVNGYSVVPGAPLPESEPVYFPDTFRFAPNSVELAPADIAVLDLVMVFMVQNPQVHLDVLGFTDSVGPDDSNLELSQRRVDSIWAYLLFGGIAPERVTATGMGEADPVASNDTPEGRAQNRRVEFVVHNLLG